MTSQFCCEVIYPVSIWSQNSWELDCSFTSSFARWRRSPQLIVCIKAAGWFLWKVCVCCFAFSVSSNGLLAFPPCLEAGTSSEKNVIGKRSNSTRCFPKSNIFPMSRRVLFAFYCFCRRSREQFRFSSVIGLRQAKLFCQGRAGPFGL